MVAQHAGDLFTSPPFLSWLVLSLSLFHNCNLVTEIFLPTFCPLELRWALPEELFSGSVLLLWIVTQLLVQNWNGQYLFLQNPLLPNVHFIMHSWAKTIRRKFMIHFNTWGQGYQESLDTYIFFIWGLKVSFIKYLITNNKFILFQ